MALLPEDIFEGGSEVGDGWIATLPPLEIPALLILYYILDFFMLIMWTKTKINY